MHYGSSVHFSEHRHFNCEPDPLEAPLCFSVMWIEGWLDEECVAHINCSIIKWGGGWWPYLHDGVEGRVSSNTEVGAGHIVTNGGRQHAHRDAKLLVVCAGLVQLQQGLKGLMVTVGGLDLVSETCQHVHVWETTVFFLRLNGAQ